MTGKEILNKEDLIYANKFIEVASLFISLCEDLDLPVPKIGYTDIKDKDDVVNPYEVKFNLIVNGDSNPLYYARNVLGKYIVCLGTVENYSDLIADLIASFMECCTYKEE